MKKYILSSCLAVMTLLSACDNYLDLTPKGESVLNKTSDYIGLIEDMYGLPIETEPYLSGDVSYYDMTTIESYTLPLVSASFFWNEEFDRAAYSTKTGNDDMYAACYKKIARYNIVIENINSSIGSSTDKAIGMAQAKIMRAYMYFNLINTFAVPYNPETAETDRGIMLRTEFSLEQVVPQVSVAAAYRLIEKDIEESIEGLPRVAPNNFRPNKAFGYGLKAKVHLFKREYDQALTASLKCIEEAEGTGTHRLSDMNTNYKEAMNFVTEMFGMAEDYFEYGGMMYSMFRTMGSSYLVRPYSDAENLLYVHGYTSGSPYPATVRKPVVDLFEPLSDLRYTYSIGTVPARPTQEPGSQNLNTPLVTWNVAGFKLSEAYLMAAECYARANNPVNAMLYINKLRKKRINEKYYEDLEAATAQEAMTIVREERKRELLLTINSFFDMRRFCAEFNETLTREYKDKVYTLKPTSHLLVFPFPVAAMQNSNLMQNSK